MQRLARAVMCKSVLAITILILLFSLFGKVGRTSTRKLAERLCSSGNTTISDLAPL
jgi:hypothetical protein